MIEPESMRLEIARLRGVIDVLRRYEATPHEERLERYGTQGLGIMLDHLEHVTNAIDARVRE